MSNNEVKPVMGQGGPAGGAPSYAPGVPPQSAGGGGAPAAAGGGPGAGPAPANPAPAPTSALGLNQIVTDYLKKKGFTKTEAVFRQETAHLGPDGRPAQRNDEPSPKRYLKAFVLLRDWIDNGLDIYKFELRKLLWPVFVYSYLELVSQGYQDEAKNYLESLRSHFEDIHRDALGIFSTITLPQHMREHQTARLYRENKYRIPLNQSLSGNLFHFLEREADAGGSTITYILQTYCHIDVSGRGPIEPYSFEAIYRRARNIDLDEIDAQEGIPGVFTGVSNRDVLDTSTPLKLGPLPMEQDLRDDVRAELEEEDQRHPPAEGRPTLVDEFDRKIKREDSADGPTRAELPLPPSRARDVVMEMQKVRENRDRFRIEGRTGGVGIPVSACMFTFHNTLGSVSCMDFSNDHQLVAVGTMDSYIRVWSLDGKPLRSTLDKESKVNNRKLVGHSGPVYGLSFSDSIANLDRNIYGEGEKPDTSTKLLLSSSADGQIRLWSLDVWACLCVYKAHDGPVFRVLWGPHGHYFASAGWDKTVRVFAQDHASAQRIMVGHDTSVSALAWHPNGTYVFSASDETDKSIRMWSVITGNCVRVFTGHTEYISALECAPNGKILASADTGGNIYLWDIDKGARIKRCRGHGKGGIPSLNFSAESNVLVSGGLDGTVRLWDVELPADPTKANPLVAVATVTGAQPAITDGSGTVVVGGGAAGAAGAAGDTIAVAAGPSSDGRTITVGGSSSSGTIQAASNTNNAATGTTAATSVGTGAAGGGGGGGGGTGGGTGKKKGKEVQITPDQISAFPTKKTPVMKVRFTRMNLVVAGGCYDPER
ncbi:TAF5-like protein [Diplogelasinospora grovesii]|uniref:TAF5-like protein n=1 Tax=Diplogelasinospora grovesii TaxID=303347 RepID=A0AAN6N708_9PEZI|nr:TAF5-like protein [Diplogelasinospora grovesii]